MFDVKYIYETKDLIDALWYKKENPDAIFIAGGTDVIIKARDLKMRDKTLISINGLSELSGIFIDDKESICVGALSTFSDISNNSIIKKFIPTLAQAAQSVGSPQIRNVGTIGGNISNGNTSSDTASTLFAYDTKIEIVKLNSLKKIESRILPIQKFYRGPGETNINNDEIVLRFIIEKKSYLNTYGQYIKYSMRNAMDIATLGCSVNVSLSDDKTILKRVRIAFGVAGPTPLRACITEKQFSGSKITDDLAEKISQTIKQDIEPRDSWRASKNFRMHIAKSTTSKALINCLNKARGIE